MGRMRVSTLVGAGVVLGAQMAGAAPAVLGAAAPAAPMISVGNSSSNGSSNGSDGIVTHRWRHSETHGGRTRVWGGSRVYRDDDDDRPRRPVLRLPGLRLDWDE